MKEKEHEGKKMEHGHKGKMGKAHHMKKAHGEGMKKEIGNAKLGEGRKGKSGLEGPH